MTVRRGKNANVEASKKAQLLLEKRAEISDQQQLDKLDKYGFAAKKERARLMARLEKA